MFLRFSVCSHAFVPGTPEAYLSPLGNEGDPGAVGHASSYDGGVGEPARVPVRIDVADVTKRQGGEEDREPAASGHVDRQAGTSSATAPSLDAEEYCDARDIERDAAEDLPWFHMGRLDRVRDQDDEDGQGGNSRGVGALSVCVRSHGFLTMRAAGRT